MAKSRTDTEAVVKLVINGQEAKTTLKELTDTQRSLNTALKNMKPSDPGYKTMLKDLHLVNRAVTEQRKELAGASAETKKLAAGWKEIAKGVVAGSLFENLAASALSYIGRITDAYAETQKFRAILTNAFNGNNDLADKSLRMLQNFAAKTPFQLSQATDAFIKLVNRGFIPTQKELIKMGDLAASQGKSLDMYVEALLDAQTGEFERLKEFGIKASKNGDTVALSFKGVTKEVKNTEAAIRGALLSFGEVEGIRGSMDAVSKTVVGLRSNIDDSWDQIFTKIGQKSEGLINGFYRAYSSMLDWINSEVLGNSLSEQMSDERLELNKLELQIRSANTTQEQRIALINKLKEHYPDYFKNISAEKGYTEELVGVFKKLNNEYVNRIILQKQNEKFEDNEERRAEQMEKLLNIEVEIREKLAKLRDKFPQLKIQGKTESEQLGNMVRQYNQLLNEQGKSAGGVLDPFFGVGKMLRNFEFLTQSVSSATKLSEKILSERDRIAKRLGLNPDKPVELKKVENPDTKETSKPAAGPKDEDLNHLQNILDKMQDAEDKARAERMEKDASEEQLIKNRYDKERRDAAQKIKDEESLSKALIAIKKAENEELETLRHKRSKDESELIDKLTKEASEEFAKFIHDRAEAQEKMFQAGMTEEQQEILAADQKYEALVAMADQYGFDTTELVKKWEKEKSEIYKKYQDKKSQDDKEEKQKKIDALREENEAILEATREVADSIFQIMANGRNHEVEARISAIERERKRELDSKELTKAQEEALNAKYDARVREERKRAFEAERRASIAQAIINGALAMTKVSSQTGILTFAFSPFIAAMTAAQIAVIASQKAPQFAKGGILPGGPSHEQGGLKLVDKFGNIQGEIEGGEPILSRETYRNNRQTIDALLYSSQRLNGANISISTSKIAASERYYRSGGIIAQARDRESVSRTITDPERSSGQVPNNAEIVERLDTLIDRATNAWNYKTFEEAQNRITAARDRQSS